jgi:hypothetical protein
MEIDIEISPNEHVAISLLDMRWNPLSNEEDIWIPVRAGAISPRIEILGL